MSINVPLQPLVILQSSYSSDKCVVIIDHPIIRTASPVSRGGSVLYVGGRAQSTLMGEKTLSPWCVQSEHGAADCLSSNVSAYYSGKQNAHQEQ